MIEVEGLTKYYGRLAAIKDVNFKVQSGEIVGFLGLNGAGKTTTMRILTCYSPASAGTARILDMDVRQESLKIRSQIGYLPENVPLYTWMRVSEYLRFVARAKGIPAGDRTSEIDRVTADVGIQNVRGKIIRSLSKGYRQRVGLAQALIGDPPILILDEPTIGLDPKQIREIRNLVKGFTENRTVILSTHILPEVSHVCNRVIIINKGSVVAQGTPEGLAREHSNLAGSELIVKASFTEARDLIKSLEGVKSVKAGEDAQPGTAKLLVESAAGPGTLPLMAKAVVEKGWELLGLRSVEVSLEDVFIGLVSRENTESEASDEAKKEVA
jgi:ABC-2 type transport system ATP-binding protein